MANGTTPQCMLDKWVVLLNNLANKGRRDFSDREMAIVVFSFLFASQDTMSSGSSMVDHPKVLVKGEGKERIRETHDTRDVG
jgi:sterol 22-desaturase